MNFRQNTPYSLSSMAAMGSDSIASSNTSLASAPKAIESDPIEQKAIESDPIEKKYDFRVYTDGAYFKQKQLGGWGLAIFEAEAVQPVKTLSGCQLSHSSLEMELIAVIKALEWMIEHHPNAYIALATDAQILLEGLFVKYSKWQANQWHSQNRNPVVFADLWQKLYALSNQVAVDYFWIKGHFKNPGNQLADKLARENILKISVSN